MAYRLLATGLFSYGETSVYSQKGGMNEKGLGRPCLIPIPPSLKRLALYSLPGFQRKTDCQQFIWRNDNQWHDNVYTLV